MLVSKSDATAAEIVRESLRVVAKLTSGTAGESGRKLCHELTTTTTKYGSRTAENLLWILSNTDDQGMRMLAVDHTLCRKSCNITASLMMTWPY